MEIKEGFLKVSGGHGIYYAIAGKGNKTILKTHGGPGSSCKLDFFNEIDLNKYRVIIFDQRGCGQSIYDNDILHENNTENTLNDMLALLDYFKVDKTILVASSWGACLSLLFAEKYPERVEKMFLSAVFLGEDDDWFIEKSKIVFPDLYDKYMKNIPSNFKNIMNCSKEELKEHIKNISNYELNLLSHVCVAKDYITEVDENLFNSKKIFLHFGINNYFLEKDQILNNADKIKDIPINIYHGRLDMLCPLNKVYDLTKKLNKVNLTIIPYENHSGYLLKKLTYKDINND